MDGESLEPQARRALDDLGGDVGALIGAHWDDFVYPREGERVNRERAATVLGEARCLRERAVALMATVGRRESVDLNGFRRELWYVSESLDRLISVAERELE